MLLAVALGACAGVRPVLTPGGAGAAAPTSSPASSAEAAGARFLANLASFAPISLTGTDDRTVGWAVARGVPALMSVDYAGRGNVTVTSLHADGTQQDLLVSSPGPYDGTSIVGLRATPAALRIGATGHWMIRLRPLADARTWEVSGTLSGTGDDVAILRPPSEVVTATVRDSSPDTFTLTASTPDTDALLVDNAGGYAGTVRLPAGSVLLGVHSSGPWSITAHP